MRSPKVQRSDPNMAIQKKPKIDLDNLTIGDRVRVNLHQNRFEEAVVKAITPIAGGATVKGPGASEEMNTVCR